MTTTDALRTAWGACQLVAAPRIAQTELGHEPDAITTRAYRVLGVRQIIQGILLSPTQSRVAHRIGGVVDILHASSMVVVAIISRERRRAAIIDGAIAACFAVAEFRR
ncbi:hypothetical protein GCM10028798_28940 [Humibacter antri]